MSDSHDDWVDELLRVLIIPLIFGVGVLVISGVGNMIFQHSYRTGILCLLGALVAWIMYKGIDRYFDLKEGKHE